MFSDPQIVALASELNHLLWTTRTPEELEQIEKRDGLDRSLLPNRDLQCGAHADVCAAIMHRAGERVVARAGYAYAINPKEAEPFNILRHYWSTTSTGLMDLSLDLAPLTDCNPVIYRNINLIDRSWKVVFKHDLSGLKQELRRLRASTECCMLYCTVNRRVVIGSFPLRRECHFPLFFVICSVRGEEEPEKPNLLVRQFMIVTVSLCVLTASLFIILSRKYDDSAQKWAYGAVGMIAGHWLKR
jgi:hypothetical protein